MMVRRVGVSGCGRPGLCNAVPMPGYVLAALTSQLMAFSYFNDVAAPNSASVLNNVSGRYRQRRNQWHLTSTT